MQLKFLDLSDNLIRDVDSEKLPQSLMILRLDGNPCSQERDLYQELFDTLPDLVVRC